MTEPKIQTILLDNTILNFQENFTWGITEGVAPYQTTIALFPDQAITVLRDARARIASANPFFKLTMEDDRGTRRVFNNVVVIGYEPFVNKYMVRIKLADSRWFWPTGHFRGDFNMKVVTGNKRVVQRSSGKDSLGEIPLNFTDEYWYKTYSLNPPIRDRSGTAIVGPWTISQIITKWREKLNKWLKFATSDTTPSDVYKEIDPFIYEQIELDDNFAGALSTLMEKVPQLGVFVTPDNQIKFFNKFDEQEVQALNLMDREFEDHGHVEYVTQELTIPPEIEVLFTIKAEILFEYFELFEPGATSLPIPPKEGRYIENVIRIPELEINITSGKTTRTCFQGEYVPLREYLDSLPSVYPSIPRLSYEYILQYFVQKNMLENYGGLGEAKPDDDWIAKIAAITGDLRSLFRINKRWLDKIVDPEAFRLAIVNPIERQKNPSVVWCDYAVKLSRRGRFAEGDGKIIVNRDAFIADTMPLRDAVACPVAQLDLAEMELGVFRVSFNGDPKRHYDEVYPCKVDNAPTFNMDTRGIPKTLDETSKKTGLRQKLANKHRLSTIISASPAPNCDSELYKMTIKLEEIKDNWVKSRLVGPKGPKVQIRIPASQATINIAWTDSTGGLTEALFGIAPITKDLEWHRLPILNEDIMYDLALAKVTEYYSSKASRWMGSKTSLFAPTVEPCGTMHGVMHHGTPEGISTEISFNEEMGYPNFEAYLSPTSRAFINGSVVKDVRK